MATLTKFYSFSTALTGKVHNFQGDTFNIALCLTAPVATNTQLSNLTQIDYTNLSSRVLGGITYTNVNGLYKLFIADLVITASGGSSSPFRYIVIYNDSAANKELVGWYDYGVSLTLTSGQFLTIDFDATNGVFTLQ